LVCVINHAISAIEQHFSRVELPGRNTSRVAKAQRNWIEIAVGNPVD
jgi:hypothetical protein